MDEEPKVEKKVNKSRKKKRVSKRRRNTNGGEGQNFSSLETYIYPSFKKMIERTNTNTVLTQIAGLKGAFDTAEEKKPGFSDRFISLIVESLNSS